MNEHLYIYIYTIPNIIILSSINNILQIENYFYKKINKY